MGFQNNRTHFDQWLKNRDLSESTRKKYTNQAHRRILRDLGIDFYKVKSMIELQQLVIDVRQLENKMEKDPRRMYSAAVGNYVKFRAEFENQLDILEDAQYEANIEEQLILEKDKVFIGWNATPQPSAKLVTGSQTRFQRNPKVGAQAILLADYSCKINPKHRFFISRRTHQNYVEAHHLIPIAYQGLFSYGVDIIENIVCLCPVCHRLIHYGEEEARRDVINQLYQGSIEKLTLVGLNIKKEELMELY